MSKKNTQGSEEQRFESKSFPNEVNLHLILYSVDSLNAQLIENVTFFMKASHTKPGEQQQDQKFLHNI